jgi:hypothetical protein
VVVVYYQRGSYLRSNDREDEYGLKDPPPGKAALLTAPYIIFFPSNFNAVARVDPPRGAKSVQRDITLDPGWSFKGVVLGPDGKPLAGARLCDQNDMARWGSERMKTAEFTAGFHPRRPHNVLFQHPEKGLVGEAQPPKANGGRVTVRLQPGASVTGRLVDANGKPWAGVELEVSFLPKGWGSWHDYSPERIRTDRHGRFRIELLIPGYKFRLSDGTGVLPIGAGLRAGGTKDLGDVQMKEEEER